MLYCGHCTQYSYLVIVLLLMTAFSLSNSNRDNNNKILGSIFMLSSFTVDHFISSPQSKNAPDRNFVKIEFLIASCCTYKDLSGKKSAS